MEIEKRWKIFCILFISYVFYVYFRKLFSLILPSIVRDIKLTKDEIGWIVSAQYVAYALGKLLFGVASDVVNPSKIIITGLSGVVISAYVMAFSTHLWHFIISSTINGFLQGSGWPAVIKHIRQMFSTAEFATTYTIMSCTNNVAGFIGPLTILLPWRQTTFMAAIIATSFIIVLVFALYQTENSSTFPIINHKSSLCNEEAKQKRFSWRLLFGSETFWIITFYYSLTMASRAIAEVWIPIFVSEHFSEVVALEATFFFEAGGFFGSIVSGIACDKLCAYFSIDESRLLTGITSTIGMLIAFAAVFSLMWISFYAFLLGFFIYACINIWGILSSDMIDVSFAGRCDALFSFISNLFAVSAGAPLSWLIAAYGYSVFPVLSTLLIIISLTAYIFTRNIPLHISSL
uniref:Major facilitator superfamily (MFS) profile domain-containing protein n=1 Tax=Parascaris univalens TaxID=6257 RepID=A0A915CBG5_PARUN